MLKLLREWLARVSDFTCYRTAFGSPLEKHASNRPTGKEPPGVVLFAKAKATPKPLSVSGSK